MSKPSSTNSPKAFQNKVFCVIGFKNEYFFTLQVFFPDYTMVAITMVIHLYPYRTEKLSPFVPMVLLYQVGE